MQLIFLINRKKKWRGLKIKHYPKINGICGDYIPWGEECICFNKLDGSNLRFEFSFKGGWYKFGTRNRLFDKSDKDYGQAIDLFTKKYIELPKIISESRNLQPSK